ncbi:Fe2+-dependent dioxygenase [Denitratisoma sp. DHT3]|uniref:Fe2+-dependent dioxygenase n=1 Tax=Denitratisoma sp. DHT3 TaxID=1981880 RepID=UPI0011989570|nr:Fe2+-dependent dioxygenase [Denitratisoma sp. DHT3]QDX82223.1 Fe2+-dependent dioxygenase [Denitratisoma sp. DHT3]
MLISIDKVLDKEEVRRFRALLEAAQWQDGANTAGTLAVSVKRNLQLEDGAEPAAELGDFILRRLSAHGLFVSAALPSKVYPPKFNCYRNGGHYGTHVDSAIMQVPGTSVTVRSDLSATLFLAEPDEYEGGELEIEGPFGIQSVKLAAGNMVLYPSSSLHRVSPVTRGARFAAFFWIQSLVQDEGARTLLFDLDQAIQGLTAAGRHDDPHLLKLTGVYHNLLRRWAVT